MLTVPHTYVLYWTVRHTVRSSIVVRTSVGGCSETDVPPFIIPPPRNNSRYLGYWRKGYSPDGMLPAPLRGGG